MKHFRSVFILGLFSFFVFLSVKANNAEESISDEEYNANNLLIRTQERFKSYKKTARLQEWEKKSNGTSDPARDFHNYLVKVAASFKKFDYQSFKNASLKRQVSLLLDMQSSGLDDLDYTKLKELQKEMKKFTVQSIVCNVIRECIPYLPNITRIITLHPLDSVVANAWVAWRNEVSPDARKYVTEYVDLYRKAAALNFHLTPSKTWYLNFERDNFRSEIDAVIEELRPLYLEFHAYVRHRLFKNLGERVLTEEGPIPAHLMDRVILQAWTLKNNILGIPYPQHHLPDLKDALNSTSHSGERLVHIGEEFFESLGLPSLPSSFWSKYCIEKSAQEAGPDCRGNIYDLYPDVGFKYCPSTDYKKLLQIHRDLAEIQYLVSRNRLPYPLNKEACPGFGIYMGEAAILSAASPRHLQKMQFIENYTLNYELGINRMFRMGVQAIFTLHEYYVHEKLWTDLLDYKIKPENMNCAYWKIQEKYAGVEPSYQRNEQHFDVGYKFYDGLNEEKSHTIKVLSGVLGYQIFKHLCLLTGSYIPGDTDNPLSNCDFHGSQKVGSVLREAMAVGSKQNWRDTMELLTGERELNASAILEYYDPLHQWLKEQNEILGVKTGWKESNKCSE